MLRCTLSARLPRMFPHAESTQPQTKSKELRARLASRLLLSCSAAQLRPGPEASAPALHEALGRRERECSQLLCATKHTKVASQVKDALVWGCLGKAPYLQVPREANSQQSLMPELGDLRSRRLSIWKLAPAATNCRGATEVRLLSQLLLRVGKETLAATVTLAVQEELAHLLRCFTHANRLQRKPSLKSRVWAAAVYLRSKRRWALDSWPRKSNTNNANPTKGNSIQNRIEFIIDLQRSKA